MTSGTAKPHTKVSKASGDGSGNDDLFVARLCAALSNAATLNNNHEKSVLDEARDNDVTSTCAMSIDSAGRMITQVVSQASIAAADAPTPTSFAQLPGEVRNRIYRAYFDIFAEEKREQIIFRTTASKYLNLLHVDRMIRSEAGSIFDTEYLCIDNFATIGVFQDPLLCRIRSISALLNIRKAGPKFSVTCTRISGPSHGFCEDLCRRVHDRRRFVQLLGRIISHWKSVESEYSRSSLHPEHDGERLFLSEKGQLRNKTRSVKEYLIQCDVQRDPWDGMAESVFHISGPLAELNWPKEHWRNLECLLC